MRKDKGTPARRESLVRTPGGKYLFKTPVGSGRSGLKRRSRTVLTGSGALSQPAIRRLARRAGVKRISAGIYDEAPIAMRSWLHTIIGDARVLAEYGKRITVTVGDILQALKRNGM